ncbi:MAG: hypothetical protein E6K70_22825, partial [Planctomycetota bacterium]
MRQERLIIATLVAFLCSWSLPVQAQTSYPMITDTYPVAVQRGLSSEVTVEGQMDFSGVYKVLIEGSGIQAE